MTKRTIEDIINKPVLSVNLSHGNRTEIYVINHTEWFTPFGGSRHGYADKKSATMILREIYPNSTKDTALDLYDPEVWDWIAKLINSTSGKARAVDHDGNEPMFEPGKDTLA
jgi:hypothetical protein